MVLRCVVWAPADEADPSQQRWTAELKPDRVSHHRWVSPPSPIEGMERGCTAGTRSPINLVPVGCTGKNLQSVEDSPHIFDNLQHLLPSSLVPDTTMQGSMTQWVKAKGEPTQN
ncbi:hypothetical protein ATANTOWER_001260 [Ataeniobius toweri]|uniref:Uncharacterized protein n=1 Tax=Ataeniobius toweri TaxID=208326 RepID=A0ABU7CEW6_9TELE|nr:hypothetical protein [Ataeniobius toweri]